MPNRRKIGVCAYCSQTAEISRDHVIPRCLFPRPLPQDMRTVPACDACNQRKARHDDFLRDMLVTDVAAEDSDVTRQLFKDKVLRSHEKCKSLVARISLNDSKPLPYLTRDGQVDVAHVTDFDPERADEMFDFIIRGLYHTVRGENLAPDTKVVARRLFKQDTHAVIDTFNKVGGIGPVTIGSNVFSCVYNYGSETPQASLWFLEFYDSVHFSAVTKPPGFCPTQAA